MKNLLRAALAVLLLSAPVLAGNRVERAERRRTSQCKTITSGTAIEMFEISCATCQVVDRKEIILQSLDVTYSTNSVRISSFAATTDAEGFAWVGFAQAYREFSNAAVRLFVRKSTGQNSSDVCAQQLE